MIGLDTNVLVRYFMQDDWDQCKQADAVMSALTSQDPGWVGLASVMELVWVSTSTYGAKRIEVLDMLDQLLSLEEIVVERAEVVQQAVMECRSTNADFVDSLIACSARAAGCRQTLTFDRKAAKSTQMTLVP